MAVSWTAGATVSTGDLITTSVWNNYLGVDGSLDYLKDAFDTLDSEVDTAIQKDGSVTYTADQPMGSNKLTGLAAGSASGHSVRYDELHALSGSNVSGSRAVNTAYQNTSGKIMAVSVTIQQTNSAANGYQIVDAKSDSSNPPTTAVAEGFSTINPDATGHRAAVFFLVENGDYYKVDTTKSNCSGDTIVIWYEWELH